jgi:quercetin dioxygenase-like cupin family protein
MLLARNAEVTPIAVTSIEGTPVLGGDLTVKPMLKGAEMTVLEIFYPAGVASSPHAHQHESVVYVIKGRLRSTMNGEATVLGPGDVGRHPKGAVHAVEALEDTLMVEVKSPAPDIANFFVARPA